MLTQFVQSINWVDVVLLGVLVTVVFISVKTGFTTEVFKFFGVFFALFAALHLYARLATICAQKTTLPLESWHFILYVLLLGVVIFIFKLLRDGILILFKVETTHMGFDKYGAGFLGAVRAVVVCSLVIFGLLLIKHDFIHKQTRTSFGYQAVGMAAPLTYKFLFDHVVGKLFETEVFNDKVFAVTGSKHGVHPK